MWIQKVDTIFDDHQIDDGREINLSLVVKADLIEGELATALQAAELAMLFNTSEVGRRRGNRTPLHDDNTDSDPTAPEPSGRLSIEIGRGSWIRTSDTGVKVRCLGPG